MDNGEGFRAVFGGSGHPARREYTPGRKGNNCPLKVTSGAYISEDVLFFQEAIQVPEDV
jgi:hypothetical protein